MKLIVICYSPMMEEWCHLVKLFCKPNLFAMEQEIIIIDTTEKLGFQVRSLAKCDFNSLGQFLAVGALSNKAEVIELQCPEVLSKRVVDDFWKESELLHANQNIKFEIRNKEV